MAVRRLEVPVPATSERLEEMLASRLGSAEAADRAVAKAAGQLGLIEDVPREVSAAMALTRLGVDIDRVAKSLAWRDFEDYCALAMSAAGYSVFRNVRLRKPTRQIDIVAGSGSLVLSVDCKHWKRGSLGSLAKLAQAQAERTKLYARGLKQGDQRAFLPVLLTLVDAQVRVVDGVPVVPLGSLREFLASVSPFDEDFAFIRQAKA